MAAASSGSGLLMLLFYRDSQKGSSVTSTVIGIYKSREHLYLATSPRIGDQCRRGQQ